MASDALRALDLAARVRPGEDLMQLLCEAVDHGMLEEIARADYGHGYAAHLAELERIHARRHLDRSVGWEPIEVLELVRWSRFGDDRTGQTARDPRGFHTMHAFACAALLELKVTAQNREAIAFQNETVIALIQSLGHLGGASCQQAAGFLARLAIGLPDHGNDIAFVGLGLIWAELKRADHAQIGADAAWIEALIDAVHTDAAVRRAHWGHGVGNWPDRWLLGTTFNDLRHRDWIALGQRMSAEIAQSECHQLEYRIERVRTLLEVDTTFDADGQPYV